MPSKEYYEGKLMEHNKILHAQLTSILLLDSIDMPESLIDKGDIIAYRGSVVIPISIKYTSVSHTQVHLSTLSRFAKTMNMSYNILELMEQWLGIHDEIKFNELMRNTNLSESSVKYRRLYANDIPSWHTVIDWFNLNRKSLAELLIQSMHNEFPAKFLVWINKTKDEFHILDIDKLVNYISQDCKWVTGSMNNGSTIRCVNSEDKSIFHLQMKGSGGKDGGYDHRPQFHIHSNWPSTAVVHSSKL